MYISILRIKKLILRCYNMNTKVFLAILTIVVLALSSYELAISPSVIFFDVQRERHSFELQSNNSLVIINNYQLHVQRIVIDLSSGHSFAVNYSLPSDTPVQIMANISSSSHTFLVDGIHYFILLSTGEFLKGTYEIDYGPQTSYP